MRSWNLNITAQVLCTGLVAAFVILRPSDRRVMLGWGVLLLALLFLSPLCALTAALFSARAAHHIVLVALVAPLLALAFPASSGHRFLSIGLIAALHAAIFWFWHAPPVYTVAIVQPVAYWAMQLTLLGSAFCLWRRVFDMTEGPGGVLFALLGTTMQMSLLGALLTFASTPLYEPHFLTTIPFGLAPIQDQQLAGLIMWVPSRPALSRRRTLARMAIARAFSQGDAVVWLKFFHIAAISIWSAGLICLPGLYVQRAHVPSETSLHRLQRLVRFLYVGMMSPAAFIGIATETALCFSA